MLTAVSSVANSTISGNICGSAGGGIYNSNTGRSTVTTRRSVETNSKVLGHRRRRHRELWQAVVRHSTITA